MFLSFDFKLHTNEGFRVHLVDYSLRKRSLRIVKQNIFLQERGLQVENVNLLAARGNLFGHVFSQLNSGTVIATLE